MAFAEKGNHGVLNGTTPVDAVASPAASTSRIVRNIVIHNKDTAEVIITINLVDSVGSVTRRLHRQTMPVDSTLTYEIIQVLDTTTKKLQLTMSAAAATTNPDFTSAYGDAT